MTRVEGDGNSSKIIASNEALAKITAPEKHGESESEKQKQRCTMVENGKKTQTK